MSDADIDDPNTPLAALIAAESIQLSEEEKEPDQPPTLSTEQMMDMAG